MQSDLTSSVGKRVGNIFGQTFNLQNVLQSVVQKVESSLSSQVNILSSLPTKVSDACACNNSNGMNVDGSSCTTNDAQTTIDLYHKKLKQSSEEDALEDARLLNEKLRLDSMSYSQDSSLCVVDTSDFSDESNCKISNKDYAQLMSLTDEEVASVQKRRQESCEESVLSNRYMVSSQDSNDTNKTSNTCKSVMSNGDFITNDLPIDKYEVSNKANGTNLSRCTSTMVQNCAAKEIVRMKNRSFPQRNSDYITRSTRHTTRSSRRTRSTLNTQERSQIQMTNDEDNFSTLSAATRSKADAFSKSLDSSTSNTGTTSNVTNGNSVLKSIEKVLMSMYAPCMMPSHNTTTSTTTTIDEIVKDVENDEVSDGIASEGEDSLVTQALSELMVPIEDEMEQIPKTIPTKRSISSSSNKFPNSPSFIAEHEIMVQAVLQLLTEREQERKAIMLAQQTLEEEKRPEEEPVPEEPVSEFIKSGPLKKRSTGVRLSWKRKFVHVRHGLLSYFDADQNEDSIEQKSISLRSSSCRCRPSLAHGAFAFELEISNVIRRYFAAENEQERDDWIKCINNAMIDTTTCTTSPPTGKEEEATVDSSTSKTASTDTEAMNDKENLADATTRGAPKIHIDDYNTESYVEAKELFQKVSSLEEYRVTLSKIQTESESLLIPLDWARENETFSFDDGGEFVLEETSIEQRWKNLQQDKIKINDTVFIGTSPHGPRRAVGALSRLIVDVNRQDHELRRTASKLKKETQIKESQAVNYSQEILLSCNRLQKNDMYSTSYANSLCGNDLVVIVPSSEQTPAKFSVDVLDYYKSVEDKNNPVNETPLSTVEVCFEAISEYKICTIDEETLGFITVNFMRKFHLPGKDGDLRKSLEFVKFEIKEVRESLDCMLRQSSTMNTEKMLGTMPSNLSKSSDSSKRSKGSRSSARRRLTRLMR